MSFVKINGDSNAIFKNLEQQFESYQVKTKITTRTFQIFWMERWRDINIITIKSKFLSLIAWIDPNLTICYNRSKTQKFNMDYNFWSGIALADSHSKHILIILVVDSQNFRKLHINGFLNLNEIRTEHRRYNTLLIKR